MLRIWEWNLYWQQRSISEFPTTKNTLCHTNPFFIRHYFSTAADSFEGWYMTSDQNLALFSKISIRIINSIIVRSSWHLNRCSLEIWFFTVRLIISRGISLRSMGWCMLKFFLEEEQEKCQSLPDPQKEPSKCTTHINSYRRNTITSNIISGAYLPG
jgi:hypothetical protein